MRTCHYCGRKNPPGTAHCSGCGTDITGPPPVHTPGLGERYQQQMEKYYMTDMSGTLSHTPPRRCECGSTLRPCHISRRYWGIITPLMPGHTEIVFSCAACGRSAVVPSRAQIEGRVVLTALYGLVCVMLCPLWFKIVRSPVITWEDWPILAVMPSVMLGIGVWAIYRIRCGLALQQRFPLLSTPPPLPRHDSGPKRKPESRCAGHQRP